MGGEGGCTEIAGAEKGAFSARTRAEEWASAGPFGLDENAATPSLDGSAGLCLLLDILPSV
jgi:hypothetical protein